MDDLIFERRDGTATITLNNPDMRNAITVEMAEEIQAAIESVTKQGDRCLVLQGSGGTFCAGGDIEAMLAGVTGELTAEELLEGYVRPLAFAIRDFTSCPVPTVAKVDGPAFGAGATLAISCDLTLASHRSKIGFGFRQVGLSIDSATSYLLPRIVGESVAKELVYSGDLLGAEEASDLGLFNRVYPTDLFETECQEFINEIATGPSAALEASKRLLDYSRERTLDECIEAELTALETVSQTADHEEGVRAFMEKRSPSFVGE